MPKSKNVDLKIEYLNVDDLKPYKNNAKKHDDEDVQAIINSIREFGMIDPVGIWGKDNIIVEGHGRLMACKNLGIEEIPCIRLDNLTNEQRKAYTLAHNKTAELSGWFEDMLKSELDSIEKIDMSEFGFDLNSLIPEDDLSLDLGDGLLGDDLEDERDPSCQHNCFENQEIMQFPIANNYGFPEMTATETTGNKMLRFMDWKEVDNPEDYIAHFYYDDYKFIQAWRNPDKYIEQLRKFKAVVSPDFSLYTDFPKALQILSCYRRQWVGAYWQMMGLDVIPDVVWGNEDSFEFCFDGIPKHSTVAVSTVGVKRDEDWNAKENDLFLKGYNEMIKRLEPTTILFYGDMIEGCEGNIIRIPSYYEQKRELLNQKSREKKENG